jgi:Protein of unknown function (DUF1559)/Domain of unknown function (DUF4190)
MTEDYDRPAPSESRTSGKAIASLILSFLFCIPIIAPIAAIVFGALSLRDISRSEGRLSGQGLALAGLVIGILGLILIVPEILIGSALMLPAVQKVRETANRAASANNLRQIGLAMHAYHDTYQSFPPAVVYSPDGKPLYSWRVLILPFLNEQRLYSQFKLDEPWDSPNNRPLLAQMPAVYVHPSQGKPTEPYATHYQVFTGGGAIFDLDPRFRSRMTDIQDGVSNTIMVVEATDPVPWTMPADLPYNPNQPLPRLGVSSSTYNALMADGSVIPVPQNTDEKTIRAMITRNGGEMVDLPGAAPPPPQPAPRPSRPRKDVIMK